MTVGFGLVVLGASSYAFLGIAARACHPGPFASLSVLWLVTVTVGIGLFLPVEQELARTIAVLGARACALRPALVAGVRSVSVLTVVVSVAALAVMSTLRSQLGLSGALLAATFLNVVAQGVAYFFRGVAAGVGAYSSYGWQLAVEGAVRLALAPALAAAGVRDPAAYGFALAGATLLSLLITALPLTRRLPSSDLSSPVPQFSSRVGWLVLAALASQVLVNSAPILLSYVQATPTARAASFFAALLVARIPLFLFAAVQAVLLPSLAAAAARGDHEAFFAALRKVELPVLGVGLLGALGAATVGDPVLRLIFGPGFAIATSTVVLLALGSAAFLVASVEGQAALARGRHRGVGLSWAAACVLALCFAFLHGDAYQRVSEALLTGSLLALVLLLSLAYGRGRSHAL